MPTLRTYRLFISHAWRYNDSYDRIVNLLDKAARFNYSNYSVPRANPVDANNTPRLAAALQRQIKPVQIVLILGGMYAAYSSWIQYEINYAQSLGKPIIGIYPRGAQRMPQVVTSAAAELVGWNTASIVAAVRRYSL
jgi:hypothetical protein